jgi:hypothetical protein
VDWRATFLCIAQVVCTYMIATQVCADPNPSIRRECPPEMLKTENVDPEIQFNCLTYYKISGALHRLSAGSLTDIVGMLYVRSIKSGRFVDADSMKIVTEELDSRPHKGTDSIGNLYSALLSVGRPAEADALIRSGKIKTGEPVMSRLPLKTAPPLNEARYWHPVLGKNQLVEQSVALNEGAHILIFSAPGCGFCRAAAGEIRADPLLYPIFMKSGLWVHIPEINYSASAFDEYWTKPNPDFPMGIIFDRNNWPIPDITGVPTFVFVKQGKIIATEKGWREGQLAKIAAHTREIGLISGH